MAACKRALQQSRKALAAVLKAQKQEHERRLEACLGSRADRVLASNQGLLRLGAGEWRASPHTCPCVTHCQSAVQACASVSVNQSSDLQAAWEKRHDVVQHSDPGDLWQRAPLRSQEKMCYKLAFCICTARGHLVSSFWSAASATLKDYFRDPGQMQLLLGGHICVVLRATRADTEEGAVVEVRTHHVPLHYRKPWRATFCRLDPADEFALQRLQAADIPDETYVALRQPLGHGEPLFQTPHLMINSLSLQHRWSLMLAVLSERPVAYPHSAGQVMVRLLGETVVQIWDGEERELAKRRRRKPQQDAAAAAASADNVVEAAARAQAPAEADVPVLDEHVSEDDGGDDLFAYVLSGSEHEVASSNDSSSSSSSTSSTSSGEDSAQDIANLGREAEEGARDAGAAPAEALHVEIERGAGDIESHPTRRVQAETFERGGFRFSFKPPSSYQALCRQHSRHERTRCTKLGSWQPNEEGGMERVLHALKCWCLRAPACEDRAQHQGSRGFPRLSDEELTLTPAELDERLAALELA